MGFFDGIKNKFKKEKKIVDREERDFRTLTSNLTKEQASFSNEASLLKQISAIHQEKARLFAKITQSFNNQTSFWKKHKAVYDHVKNSSLNQFTNWGKQLKHTKVKAAASLKSGVIDVAGSPLGKALDAAGISPDTFRTAINNLHAEIDAMKAAAEAELNESRIDLEDHKLLLEQIKRSNLAAKSLTALNAEQKKDLAQDMVAQQDEIKELGLELEEELAIAKATKITM